MFIWRTPMNELSWLGNLADRCASAMIAALLVAAPVASAFAQSNAPAGSVSTDQTASSRANQDSERDPISLEAVQEGVRNFELRREMDLKRQNAAGAADDAKRRAVDAVKSDEKPGDRPIPAGERRPPRDAMPHQGGGEATMIQSDAPSRPLSAPKARPKPPADYPSRSESDVRPVEIQRIGY